MFLVIILPAVICILITITRKHKLFWLSAIPSVIQFIFWSIMFFGHSEGGMILPTLKFMLAIAYVAVFYFAVFVVKKIKKIKNKKGDDTSC